MGLYGLIVFLWNEKIPNFAFCGPQRPNQNEKQTDVCTNEPEALPAQVCFLLC
jgi:hypothetical protein